MKRFNSLLDILKERIFSSTYQLQRIVILTAIALVLIVVSFGSYYYYDRYYTSQPKTADVMLEEAEKAAREKPNDPEVRLNLAETYMLNRRFDEALSQANIVMKSYPDNQHAWLVVGVANNLNGNPALAIEPLAKFLDANKDTEMPGLNKAMQSAAFYLGDSYLALGKPEQAVAPLEQAVDWSQTDADAMYKLGMAYMGVKRFDDSLAMFQAATRFVPNYVECYEGMAAAYDGLNEPDFATYARGMVAYSKKDYKSALPMLLEAVNANSNFIPAINGLALTYEAMGDLKNAKTNYEAAVNLNPNDFTATSGLQRVDALLKK